jgi:hypothetical protein
MVANSYKNGYFVKANYSYLKEKAESSKEKIEEANLAKKLLVKTLRGTMPVSNRFYLPCICSIP